MEIISLVDGYELTKFELARFACSCKHVAFEYVTVLYLFNVHKKTLCSSVSVRENVLNVSGASFAFVGVFHSHALSIRFCQYYKAATSDILIQAPKSLSVYLPV